jgi:DNA-binding transcriptional MerR regulator
MGTEGLLPIGTFARLCRLSVKRLRHYDELGLLAPAWVDPHTGYRYYRPAQVRDAAAIGLLRSIDVPLATIGEVLSGTGPKQALRDVRDQLEADLGRRRRALAMLERILAEGMPQVEASIVEVRARQAAAVRDVADDQDRIGLVTSECVATLLAALAAAGVVFRPPLTGLFPLDLADQVPVTVAAIAARPVPGTRSEILPGGSFASATHVGPYDQIGLTGHGLLSWCVEHGHVPTGPLREVYVSNPADTPPEQLVTHLMIALEEKP